MPGIPRCNERSLCELFHLTDSELKTLKQTSRDLHEQNGIQERSRNPLNSSGMYQFRKDIWTQAIEAGRVIPKVSELFKERGRKGHQAKDALVWLLWQSQYRQTRMEKAATQRPRPSETESSEAEPSETMQPTLTPIEPGRLHAEDVNTRHDASRLPASNSYTSDGLQTTASALSRAFLIARNQENQTHSVICVDELPSAGLSGVMTEADWYAWIEYLRITCGYERNKHTIEMVWKESNLIIINRVSWRSACLLCVDDALAQHHPHMQPLSLQIVFDIQVRPVEKETTTTLPDNDGCVDEPGGVDVPGAVGGTGNPNKTVERNKVHDKGNGHVHTSDETNMPVQPREKKRAHTDNYIDNDKNSSYNKRPREHDYRPSDRDIIVLSDTDIETEDSNEHQVDDSESDEDAGQEYRIFEKSMNRCQQMSDERWQEFLTFFLLPHDSNNGRDPSKPIPIPHMKRHPFPYQLYGVFWMLQQERKLEQGGFVGDEMGLGKTMETITYFVLNVLLVWNHRDVQDNPSNHLPDGHESPICPSQEKYPFRCACVSAVYSARNIPPRPGPTMIIVPSKLRDTWIEQWMNAVGQDSNLNLFVGHNGVTISRLKSIGHANIHSLATHGFDKLRPSHGPGQNISRESLFRATSVAVLTTPGSQHHVDWFRKLYNSRGHVIKSMPWRAILRDEFHEEKRTDSTTIRVFLDLVRSLRTRPAVWLLSGTPFDRGPIDVKAWMGTLRTPSWSSKDSPLIPANEFNFDRMSSRVQSITSKQRKLNTRERKLLQNDANTFSDILSRLMIRRVTEDRWFDMPLVQLPPTTHLDIQCKVGEQFLCDLQSEERKVLNELKDSYQQQLAQWNQHPVGQMPKLHMKSFFNNSRKTRLYAIFPFLLHMGQEYGLSFTQQELLDYRKRRETPPYDKNIQKLVESSAKCQ